MSRRRITCRRCGKRWRAGLGTPRLCAACTVRVAARAIDSAEVLELREQVVEERRRREGGAA